MAFTTPVISLRIVGHQSELAAHEVVERTNAATFSCTKGDLVTDAGSGNVRYAQPGDAVLGIAINGTGTSAETISVAAFKPGTLIEAQICGSALAALADQTAAAGDDQRVIEVIRHQAGEWVMDVDDNFANKVRVGQGVRFGRDPATSKSVQLGLTKNPTIIGYVEAASSANG